MTFAASDYGRGSEEYSAIASTINDIVPESVDTSHFYSEVQRISKLPLDEQKGSSPLTFDKTKAKEIFARHLAMHAVEDGRRSPQYSALRQSVDMVFNEKDSDDVIADMNNRISRYRESLKR